MNCQAKCCCRFAGALSSSGGAVSRPVGVPDQGEQYFSHTKPPLAHFGFVNHDVFADPVHTIINVNIDGAVVQRNTQRVVEKHRVTFPARRAIANDIAGGADVSLVARRCQRPDSRLLLSVVEKERFIQRADAV